MNQVIAEELTGSNPWYISFVYDPVGNRLVRNDLINKPITTSTYDAANQLIQTVTGGTVNTVTYDANGNRTLENDGGALTTYTYDLENRLLIFSNSTNVQTNYYYGDGKRRRKDTGGTTLQNIWDMQNLLETTDGSGVTQSVYTDYPGYWGGLISARGLSGTPSTNYFVFDINGDMHFLVDSSGTILQTTGFDAFGDMGATNSPYTPFRYKGKYGYYDDKNNFYLAGARVVDGTNGRWLTPDPSGFEGGDWNLYRYVENNPVILIDPLGLAPSPWCLVPCIPCVSCGVDYAAACGYCGTSTSCWKTCIQGVTNNLPPWLKWGCGGACVGCIACLLTTGRAPRPPKPPPYLPGTLCSPAEIARRQFAVAVLCHNTPSCKRNMDCDLLKQMSAIWSACIAARKFAQACFTPASPGWSGHQTAIKQAETNLINCGEDIILHVPPCSGMPTKCPGQYNLKPFEPDVLA